MKPRGEHDENETYKASPEQRSRREAERLSSLIHAVARRREVYDGGTRRAEASAIRRHRVESLREE
jgi:hypothetical protein